MMSELQILFPDVIPSQKRRSDYDYDDDDANNNNNNNNNLLLWRHNNHKANQTEYKKQTIHPIIHYKKNTYLLTYLLH